MNWCIRNGGCGGLRRIGRPIFKDDAADAIEDLDGIEVALII